MSKALFSFKAEKKLRAQSHIFNFPSGCWTSGYDSDPVIFDLPDPVLFWPDHTPYTLFIGKIAYITEIFK